MPFFSSPELRIQEMVSKGIGDKPFLDIQAHSQGHLSALLMGRGEGAVVQGGCN